MTLEERETILLTNAATDTIEIGTSDQVFIRKLEKLSEEYPETYKRVSVNEWGEHSYTMPKRYLRFGKPASEARREANRRNGASVQFQRRIGRC
jgi:hypothetical protein